MPNEAWLRKMSATSVSPAPSHYYYHKRLLQGPGPAYTVSENNQLHQVPPGTIPSMPVQVPLHAHLTPASNIQNVQLVPCLCPVSQDYFYDSRRPPQQENVFVPVQQERSANPQPQQQIVHGFGSTAATSPKL
ncbi:hypothetical protein NQ317_005902 [Molorchus minor]|uniref:Uncharacterized protein n=1 Tax=Molorchus minor TaxID=1323400 RepID=A0ABQ9J0M8_9CUCU|nr:hypothetical protein NQ317_005902 [Molorchus minor]